MIKAPKLPERPGWRDYFQIITTIFMVGLGSCILWKTIFVRWAIPPLIFGAALLLYGLFRIRMIWAYFEKRGRGDGI